MPSPTAQVTYWLTFCFLVFSQTCQKHRCSIIRIFCQENSTKNTKKKKIVMTLYWGRRKYITSCGDIYMMSILRLTWRLVNKYCMSCYNNSRLLCYFCDRKYENKYKIKCKCKYVMVYIFNGLLLFHNCVWDGAVG